MSPEDKFTGSHPWTIERGDESFLISFDPHLSDLDQRVLVGVFVGDSDKAIENELRLNQGEVRRIVYRLKNTVLERRQEWPLDRMALISALQKLDDIKIQNLGKRE
ncbi:hypothetical protein MUP46_00095 [Patescibacteria group bacterium]|nr:hypothetical protein [Patescibacteria group bacterium]